MEDSRVNRLRRLKYQAIYTGMKETDLLLGHFAKTHLESLSDQQLDDFEALLDAGDDRIHAWVMGNEPVPAAYDTKVFELIKRFK
jgi:antitoxin CptB